MSEPSLPSPWEKRIDPKTGWPYYLNHDTQTTQWQEPNLTTSDLSSQHSTTNGSVNIPVSVGGSGINRDRSPSGGLTASPHIRKASSVSSSNNSSSQQEVIAQIRQEAEQFHSKIESFTGVNSSKDYKYLEEMMERNLCKLDNIEANGDETIRNQRKDTVRYITQCLDQLELKALANATKI